jgi:hypothetical protein
VWYDARKTAHRIPKRPEHHKNHSPASPFFAAPHDGCGIFTPKRPGVCDNCGSDCPPGNCYDPRLDTFDSDTYRRRNRANQFEALYADEALYVERVATRAAPVAPRTPQNHNGDPGYLGLLADYCEHCEEHNDDCTCNDWTEEK